MYKEKQIRKNMFFFVFGGISFHIYVGILTFVVFFHIYSCPFSHFSLIFTYVPKFFHMWEVLNLWEFFNLMVSQLGLQCVCIP